MRVKVTSMFGSVDEEGSFQEEKDLDPGLIEIHYNTDLWTLEDDGTGTTRMFCWQEKVPESL